MTAIDTESWRTAVDDQRVSSRGQLRDELALEGAVVLFVGVLDRRKGVPALLAALTAVAEIPDLPPWSVLMVGSGPLGPEVDRWAAAHPEVRVVRTGFVQPAYMAKYYAASDIFVLASLEDPWGAVCLEALIAGLPQVTSSKVGSAPDLVVSSDIGDIVDPRNVHAFACCLAGRIRESPRRVPDRLRGDASAKWSPSAAATRGLASIRACLKVSTSHMSAEDG